MSSKRLVISALLAVMLVSTLLMAGCAGDKAAESDLKIAVVFLGPVSDGGYNSALFEGFEAARNQGLDISYSEVAVADIEQTLRNYGSQGYNLIFCHSGTMAKTVQTVAPDFPNTRFVEIAGIVTDCTNVTSLNYSRPEMGFLAGVVAGTVSKSGKVGIVQAIDFPAARAMEDGFRQGAQHVNPSAEILAAYTGTFDDVVKGKEAALAQIGQGVDVICHNAGWCGTGMIQAVAEQEGVFAIGYPLDQNALAPKKVVTSISLGFETLIPDYVALFQKGELQTGTIPITIENGGITLAPFYGLIPAQAEASIRQIVEDIKAGKIKVGTGS
jgi:basic membrane protein A